MTFTLDTQRAARTLTHWATMALAGVVLAISLAGFVMVTAPQHVQAQSCLSGAQIRSAISSSQLLDFASVQSIARSRGYTVVDASVCSGGSSLVYRVLATSNSGASARLVIDGVSGAILSER